MRTSLQQFIGTEHAAILLHGGANRIGDILHALGTGAGFELGQARQRDIGGVGWQRLVAAHLQIAGDDMVAGSTAEHDQVEQRVGAETIGAMHRDAGAFADGVHAIDDFIVDAIFGRHHLAVDVGRNTTHLVVDGRHHRDRLLGRVDVGELVTDLQNRRQALLDGIGADMTQVQQYVVLVRSAAAAFLDFLVHRARYEVAWCQVLQGRRIALHEALAIGVDQDTALAAHAFGDQDAGAGHAGRVELPELHVLQRQAGTRRHAHAVAGIDEGIGRGGKNTPGTTGREQGGLGFQHHHFAGFHFQRNDAQDIAILIADQVDCHPFDEEMGLGAHIALIQRMQQCVAGTVSRGASALYRLFTEIGGVATEWTLINRAVRVTVERHAEVFELVHDFRRFTTHVFDRVLVTEIVAALDGVEHVPEPVVFRHIAE